MARVDVIMATYNGEKFVGKQIESILENKGCDIFIHVFDDMSTDHTTEIVKEYEKNNPGKLMIYKNPKNYGCTMNFLHAFKTVMEHCHEAEYFMCCDQDDVWNKDKVEKTLKRMKQMEERYDASSPLLVFTDAIVTDENLIITQDSFFRGQHLNVKKLELSNLLMENKVIGCTTMFNRAYEPFLWEIPSHVRYHDWWLALIAAGFGHISYLPSQTLLYRQHASNVVGGMKFATYVKTRMTGLNQAKESLIACKEQADEFLKLYEEGLPLAKKLVVEDFLMMFQQNFIKRRITAYSHGYMKSGAVRNIGMFLIL